MDRVKLLAQAVIALGLLFLWPGPKVLELLRDRVAPIQVAPVLVDVVEVVEAPPRPSAVGEGSAESWFGSMKPFCNPVEVKAHLTKNPAPESFEGRAHEAACLALAGRTDRARSVILSLPAEQRWQAMTTVFEVGHPIADAGDDLAAGPIMELVVEFWPNHYMALYHAGASRFALEDFSLAKDYLERFLRQYRVQDGWRSDAERMLGEIASSSGPMWGVRRSPIQRNSASAARISAFSGRIR